MLDVIRRKSGSWIVKVMLGMIILVFALFFGFSQVTNQSSSLSVVAKVNGVPITQGEYQLTYDNLYNFYKQVYKDGVPPNIAGVVKQSALAQLVNQTLLMDYAQKMNLAVSKEELFKQISSDPQFISNGKFDPIFYRNTVLPYFERKYNIHYEDFLAKRLLSQKVKGVIDQFSVTSEKEIADAYRREKTTWKVKMIKINPATLKKSAESTETVSQIATKVQASLASSKDLAALLNQHSLTVTTESITLANRHQHLGNGGYENLKPFFDLTSKNQPLTAPLSIGGTYYAITLLDHTTPTEKEMKKEIEEFTINFLKKKKDILFQNLVATLNQNSNIETYLQ
jgi:hypothetical protein